MKKKSYRHSFFDEFLKVIVWVSSIITFSILLFIICYVLVSGIPHLKPSLFALEYTSENVSLLPALISTIIITLMSLTITVPLGIFASIYLVEYASKKNRIVQAIRLATESLSGIPSIVYGLFGLLFFVTYLKWGFSLLSGSFTLGIMILPLIMRSSEEALKSVPDSYREGCYALGAGRLRAVFHVVLPAATRGILAGVILAIGRIVGESAALIYTAGTVAQIPTGLHLSSDNVFWLKSARTLSVHMYALSSEGLYTNQAYATAVVLLLMTICINALSAYIAKKIAVKQ